MENTQTAIDFLLHEISQILGVVHTDAFQNLLMIDAYNKAKAMEKDQIMRAYLSGEVGEIYELKNTLTAKQYYENNYEKIN